jgi:hypothetical protein
LAQNLQTKATRITPDGCTEFAQALGHTVRDQKIQLVSWQTARLRVEGLKNPDQSIRVGGVLPAS